MKILFVCKANVARSQMAAGLYNKISGTNNADSSGTQVDFPNESLSDRRSRRGGTYVLDVMEEEGIDISQNRRKQLTKDALKHYDKIINMAEKKYTPRWLSASSKCVDWEVKDPDGKMISDNRNAKDDIKSKIVELLGKS